jgi:hypothetical protein
MSGPIKFMILAIVVGIEKSPTCLFLKIVVQRSTIHTELAQLYSEDRDLPHGLAASALRTRARSARPVLSEAVE